MAGGPAGCIIVEVALQNALLALIIWTHRTIECLASFAEDSCVVEGNVVIAVRFVAVFLAR